MEIRLPLQEIAQGYDKEKLEKVEHELTEEDYEFYNTRGWDNYRPENHISYLLPPLGEPVYLGHSSNKPVVEVNGKRYKVNVVNELYGENWEAKGKTLVLIETNEPLSIGQLPKLKYEYQFFGQPRWVQGERFPAHNGKPCSHFLTIENGWGDCGNWNILIACDEAGLPCVAYFEASCC